MAEPQIPLQVQQQLQQLQAANQNLQATAQQRAQFEAMKAEAEQVLEALGALADDAPLWRSVGSLLVADTKPAAVARLKDEAETLEVRIARLQKQEAQLKDQLGQLQQKIQSALAGKA
jgi:prefoldin beta subunit